MDKIEYSGEVRDGKLHIRNRSNFDKALNAFIGEVEVIVQKKKVVRSDNQNKLWWSVVIPQMQEGFRGIGYDWSKDDCHQWIKANFNYAEKNIKNGDEVFRFTLSTARLTKSEFAKLIERVAQFAAEYLGVELKLNK